jgi:hypothetical protein
MKLTGTYTGFSLWSLPVQILGFSVLVPAEGIAQEQQRSAVDQIGLSMPRDANTGLSQVTAGDQSDGTSPAPPRRSEGSAQITVERRSAPAQPQLTSERGAVTPGNQLTRGRPTASAPEGPSTPAQGRSADVSLVAGLDRCDPAEGGMARPECNRVIEMRAGEFSAPTEPVLSAEQRLLAEQRRREIRGSERNAARQLAEEADAEALGTQGIASVVLRRTPNPGEEPASDTEAKTAEAIAVVNAILNSGGGSPQ